MKIEVNHMTGSRKEQKEKKNEERQEINYLYFNQTDLDKDLEKINVCFVMWIEFGPTLGMPLEPRIKKKFPELTTKEISQYSKECVLARNAGHKFVNDKAQLLIESPKKLNEEFIKFMKSKHSWMSDENIAHIYSQSCYYALK